MKPGCKQTEVGVIPEEWDVKPLGEIGGVRMCKRVLKHRTREHGDVPFYKIGTFGGVADAFITQSLFDEFKLKYSFPRKGDVLISAAGTIGRTVVYDGAPAYFQDSNIVWIDNDESKATNAYLWHRYQVTKWSVSHGGTVARLYNDNLRTKIHIPVPTLPEQRAIATALSDVDGLLDGLDRLIAKKRDLKQAAMQQLLTGQTRLPGFHGEWEKTKFENVVRHHAGNSTLIKGKLPSSEATGLFPAYSASGQDVWCRHYENEGDAIVVSAVGSRCGKAFKASGKWCAIANTHVVWPNSAKIDGRFLAYFINDEDFWQKSGTGQPFVLFTKTFARPLRLPKLPEQTAIAEVLTEMDAELAALEQRREKTRALKQAMMQELLTGRTRLV